MTKKNNKKTKTSRAASTKKIPAARTADGRVPQGRTLSTYDNYLGDGYKTGSQKKRPVVVIEANKKNELAVVPLSKSKEKGKNRTHLDNYQQGQSDFKHYVEITDNEGKPIRINKKFRENKPEMDLSRRDTEKVKTKVLTGCKQASENRKKMEKFRE